MDDSYRAGLRGNIWKYYVYRILNKRAFLPLIAVYATEVAGLTFYQFGLVAAITAFVQFALEVPSGYFADKFGHKRTLVIGSFLVAVSAFAYVLWPNFLGVTLGSAVFFAGVAFHSGTIEAFIHDTLLELNEEHRLAKVLGAAQTVGLIGNVFVVSLVPLTYNINVTFPFIIGGFLLALELFFVILFTSPRSSRTSVSELEHISFTRLLKAVRSSNNHVLFLFLGIATAVVHKGMDFKELYFVDIGAPVATLGFLIALASLLGAVFSSQIHRVHAFFSASKFYVLDALLITFTLILVGVTTNLLLGAALFIFLMAYSRVRHTPIHSYLLEDSPTQKLKATYLSLYAFSRSLNSSWVPLLLGYLVSTVGIRGGHLIFGVTMLALLIAIYWWYQQVQHRTSN